jgi:hypothetical protein
MNISNINKIYRIQSKQIEDIFVKKCDQLYQRHLSKEITVCCMDMEFNMNWKTKTHYISLIQVMLISDIDRYKKYRHEPPVFLFSPKSITDESMKIFIEKILCSPIIKILHGSDSLDCPYIYRDLLDQNLNNFVKFLNSTVDTRFLCELAKHLRDRIILDPALITSDNNTKTNKCSYYHALLNNGVIDRPTFDDLEKESKKINYNKPWDINKLSDIQIRYAVYDVVYLYDLLVNLTNTIATSDHIDLIQVVNGMFRLTMMTRLKLIKLPEISKRLFDEQNVNQNDRLKLDQQIQESKIGSVEFTDHCYTKLCHDKPTKIDVFMDDLMSITTLKNSLLYLIRPNKLILNKTYKDAHTIKKKLDRFIKKSHKFNNLNGSTEILKLIQGLTPILHDDVKCDS